MVSIFNFTSQNLSILNTEKKTYQLPANKLRQQNGNAWILIELNKWFFYYNYNPYLLTLSVGCPLSSTDVNVKSLDICYFVMKFVGSIFFESGEKEVLYLIGFGLIENES